VILAVIVYGVVGFGCAAALVLTHHTLWHFLLLLGFACFFVAAFASAVREAFSPRPGARLDRRGIEGAFGRLAWSDVRDATIRWRGFSNAAQRRLVLRLDEKSVGPVPSSGGWSSPFISGRSMQRGDEILIPTWGNRGRVMDDVHDYYPAAHTT
jgi:hypothetical protein